MRIKFKLQKEIIFLMLFVLGMNNFTLLVIIAEKILPGLEMRLSLLIAFLNSPASVDLSMLPLEFYIAAALTIYLAGSLLKVTLAFCRLLTSIVKTRIYISRLNTTAEPNQKYLIINTKAREVFTAGFTNPKIYISKGLLKTLNDQELRAIMTHEKFHVNKKDPFRQLMVSFICEAMLILPFRAKLLKGYQTITELAADESAQDRLISTTPIITAIAKLVNYGSVNLAFAKFGNIHNRVEILIGKYKFETGKYIASIAAPQFVLMGLSFILSATNLVIFCHVNV